MRLEEVPGAASGGSRQVRDALLSILLFSLSISLYTWVGGTLSSATAQFSRSVVGADSCFVIRALCDASFSPRRHRITAHPLFSLFFKPAGERLAESAGRTKAAMMLNGGFASLGIALFYCFLRSLRHRPLPAFLFSAILCVSTPHLIFGSIPETYAFSFASLISLLLLPAVIQDDRKFLAAYLPASVFAVGITATNLVLCMIVLAARFRTRRATERAVWIGLFLVALLAALAGLVVLQNQIYPALKSIFTAQMYLSNTRFVRWEFFQDPVRVFLDRIPHFFLFNVWAPAMVGNRMGFPPLASIRMPSLLAIVLYLLLASLAVGSSLRRALYRSEPAVVLLAYLAFNVVFHMFYGHELHLYAGHYTFALIALLSLPLATCDGSEGGRERIITAAVGLLVILLLANNVWFAKGIASSVATAPASHVAHRSGCT